jgi:hypothetical protein
MSDKILAIPDREGTGIAIWIESEKELYMNNLKKGINKILNRS